jgi:hypothetical protein
MPSGQAMISGLIGAALWHTGGRLFGGLLPFLVSSGRVLLSLHDLG